MNISRDDRKAIEDRINQIAGENRGKITPELVVADASDKNSPLHRWIEWDDDKAAYQHRLDQARRLISSVRIVIEEQEITLKGIAYVRDTSLPGGQQGYISITRLKGRKAQAAAVVRYEALRAIAAMDRAREVAAVLNLSIKLEEIISEIESLHDSAVEQ